MPDCSCGFTETDAETLTDHLLEAFTPVDNQEATASPTKREAQR